MSHPSNTFSRAQKREALQRDERGVTDVTILDWLVRSA